MKNMKTGKYISVLVMISAAALFSACGEKSGGEMKKDGQAIDGGMQSIGYEAYEGTWTTGGAAHSELIADGGAELVCTVSEKNKFSGSFYTWQAGTERFAEIERLSGSIENDEAYCSFSDDGWGGKGKVHILFSEDKLVVEIQDFQMAEDNATGYGASGSYELLRAADEEADLSTEDAVTSEEMCMQKKAGPLEGTDALEETDIQRETGTAEELSCDEMLCRFYEQHYDGWSQEDIEQAVKARNPYYKKSSYYKEITDYWEEVREVRDISNVVEPLYFTDMKYYEEDDFQGASKSVLRLARNEIYARHGYSFKDEDLYNYFMGCIWYQPIYSCQRGDEAAGEFDEAVFNEYEQRNLELLVELEGR